MDASMVRTREVLIVVFAAGALFFFAACGGEDSHQPVPADAGPDVDATGDATSDTDTQGDELTASFTFSEAPKVLELVQFDASASDDPEGSTLTYTWDFGDGNSGTGVHTSHTYGTVGDYEVVLTVSTGDGRQATSTVMITVEERQSGGPATLTGTVRDPSGGRLSGVRVTTVDGEESTTDTDGHYELTIQSGVPQAVRYEREGYAVGIERLDVPSEATEWRRNTTLMRRAFPQFLADAENGGEVTGKDGLTIAVGPDVLVDQDGNSVTGDVAIYATPVDVSDPARRLAFPGAFEGIDGGTQGVLASFGVMELQFRQGETPVEVAPGETLEVLIPVYTSGVREGDTIPLWSLDERTGQWTREGTATVESSSNSPTGLAASGAVTGSVWYNLDVIAEGYSAGLSFTLTDGDGNATGPLPAGSTCNLRTLAQTGPINGLAYSVPGDAESTLTLWPEGPTQIEATAANGRYVGSATVEGESGGAITETIGMRDRFSAAASLNYGDTRTDAFPTDADEVVYRFDVAAQSFSSLRVETPGGSGFKGRFTVWAPDGPLPARRVSAGRPNEAIFLSNEAGEGFVVIQADEGFLGDYTVEFERETDFQSVDLDSSVTGSLQDGEAKSYQFRGEAGAVVTPRAFGLEQEASVTVFDTAGNLLTGERDAGTQFYELETAGYYTVRIESQWPSSPETTDYTFIVNEVRPPTPLAIVDTRATVEAPITVPGTRRLYAFSVREDAGLNVRLEAKDGVTEADLGLRIYEYGGDFYRGSRLVTSTVVAGSGIEGGLTNSRDRVVIVDVYGNTAATGDFALTVDRVPAGLGTYVVDPDFACPGANARGLDAVSFAADDGATIELCDGTHRVGDGVRFTQNGLTVTGTSQTSTILRAWPGANQTVERRGQGAFELTKLTLEIGSRMNVKGDGFAAQLNGTGPSLTLDSVTVKPAQMTTQVDEAISIAGTTGAVVTLNNIEVLNLPDGATGIDVRDADTTVTNSRIVGGRSGLRLDDCAPIVVEDNDVSGQTSVAVRQAGSSAGDASIQRNVITYNGTSEFSYALQVSERGTAADQTSTIADNEIVLDCSDCSGVELSPNAPGSNIEFLRNRLIQRGAAGGTMVYVNSSGTGLTGGVPVLNNLFDGGADTVISVPRTDQLDALRLVNNTVRLADVSGGTIRILDLGGNTGASWPTIEVVNNIFVGRTSGPGDVAVDSPPSVSVDGDYNLFFGIVGPAYQGGGTSSGTNDISGADPLLDANGVPGAGSPAIDAGTTQGAPPTDIDGVARPQGSAVDIGAYEK
jgi:hypothetical protein